MRVIALIRRLGDVALVRAGVPLGETVALTVAGDDEARPLAAAAQVAGAKRVVRVWDPALATTDYLGVAYALAAAVRALGDPQATPMLILAGDRGRGVVGPAVAERLGVPLLGQVTAVDLREGKVVARRRAREVIRSYAAAPPALVCILPDATAASIDAGDLGEMESWTLSKVGLSGAELGYRKHFATRPMKGPPRRAQTFDDVVLLAERLGAEGLLDGSKG